VISDVQAGEIDKRLPVPRVKAKGASAAIPLDLALDPVPPVVASLLGVVGKIGPALPAV